MNIYPAIDLKSGRCVRLCQGNFNQVTIYEKTPLDYASMFEEQGAKFLHIIDLDGARKGKQVNLEWIKKIKQETGLILQVGGGIRSREVISQILNLGIDKVILGSVAVTEISEVKKWLKEFGAERIVLALDVKIDKENMPKLAIYGWEKVMEKNLWELLDEYEDSLLRHVLCTDINCDGNLQGPNFDLYTICISSYPSIHFQASGGVRSASDLQELSSIGMSGAIVGKAFYENRLALSLVFN